MTTKSCRKCGIEKPIDDFYKHPQMGDGHLNSCKTCVGEANAARLAIPENRERDRDRHAAWRAANPDRWKEIQVRAQANAITNGTAARSAEKRRARVKAARITTVSLKGVLAKHGMLCGICGKTIEDERSLTFDHVVPLARGGEHSEGNLRPAHRSCNSWKGDRLSEELVGLAPPEPGVIDEEWEARRREKARQARSEVMKRRMSEMTPKQKEEHGRKISEAKKGVKFSEEHCARIAEGNRDRQRNPEAIAKRADANRLRWESKTPEEREAWKARCREVKKGSPGNIENLKKGWDPEVRAKAIEMSAELRRGTHHPEEQKIAISESLKRAYAEGRRERGHTEETKRKISETKCREGAGIVS